MNPSKTQFITVADQKKLSSKISHFVCDSYSPFSLVESEGFISLVNEAFQMGKKYSDNIAGLVLTSRKPIKTWIKSEFTDFR